MSTLSWYWHRLRAMSPREAALRVRKRFRQSADAKRMSWPTVNLDSSGVFPRLPSPKSASPGLSRKLRLDVDDILRGRWRFFSHLEVKVEDPPKWQYDYLVGRELASTESAFQLNYRDLPAGADSKVIWEPSRWYQIVRLAMGAYVLGRRDAAEKCLTWLEDWADKNPPYRGWNWTSALEVGIRLIQFAWIDELLDGFAKFQREGAMGGDAVAPEPTAESITCRLSRVRQAILPPHVWYAWRHRSFGSSANNHLLGELAGCIVATARWPELAACGASLDQLQYLWEREVLQQFAEDGGNKEQALNYQLFSWEFCWQSLHALCSTGRRVSHEVYLRIFQAADFFIAIQGGVESWDFGDSDDAFVTPFFFNCSKAATEWRDWLIAGQESFGLDYWMSECRWALRKQVSDEFAPILQTNARHYRTSEISRALGEGWMHYKISGYCIARTVTWFLRWDLSPLGFLSTAAHGHLDALHLSIWMGGIAVVIDPGTGSYHASRRVRNWLASRQAHNAPCPDGLDYPPRMGPFLWGKHHPIPQLAVADRRLTATLELPGMKIRRSLQKVPDRDGWTVADACELSNGRAAPFHVRWQFAPGSTVKRLSERRFRVRYDTAQVDIEVSDEWSEVELVEPVTGTEKDQPESMDGIVAPAFRKLRTAPCLKLTARGDQPCVFTTTFLASAHS